MATVDLVPKLSAMLDEALSNLHANAARLRLVGSRAQRESAERLLPAIEAELAARRAAKMQRAARTRRDAFELRVGRRKAPPSEEAAG